MTYLFVGFEDGAPEHIGIALTGDITKYLEVLGIVRDVEYPVDRVGQYHRFLVDPIFSLKQKSNHLNNGLGIYQKVAQHLLVTEHEV